MGGEGDMGDEEGIVVILMIEARVLFYMHCMIRSVGWGDSVLQVLPLSVDEDEGQLCMCTVLLA